MAGSEFVEVLVGVGSARIRDLFKRAKVTDCTNWLSLYHDLLLLLICVLLVQISCFCNSYSIHNYLSYYILGKSVFLECITEFILSYFFIMNLCVNA